MSVLSPPSHYRRHLKCFEVFTPTQMLCKEKLLWDKHFLISVSKRLGVLQPGQAQKQRNSNERCMLRCTEFTWNTWEFILDNSNAGTPLHAIGPLTLYHHQISTPSSRYFEIGRFSAFNVLPPLCIFNEESLAFIVIASLCIFIQESLCVYYFAVTVHF